MRTLTGIALAVALAVVTVVPVAAADDLRTIWDNKSENIQRSINNENWQGTSDKSLEWAQQLGAYDGSYPVDVDDANCEAAYDSLYTVSGSAAFGGKAMGDHKGNPGLVGNIMYNGALIQGPDTRAEVDVCVASAALPEASAAPEVAASPEASES